MPHITIEYSANLADRHDIAELVDTVHGAALRHGLPEEAALRTRAVARQHYRVADGIETNAFVAITVRIGPGRDPAAKTSFIETLIDAAEARIASEDPTLDIAWSIELVEIDADYRINRNYVRAAMAARDHGATT